MPLSIHNGGYMKLSVRRTASLAILVFMLLGAGCGSSYETVHLSGGVGATYSGNAHNPLSAHDPRAAVAKNLVMNDDDDHTLL
jgi:hypothetical protein